jgi:hypothetical protein
VAENQPINKHRLNHNLVTFAARLRQILERPAFISREQPWPASFESLALELFALQFDGNPAYRKICQSRRQTPDTVEHWTQIPHVSTSVFKELDLSCLLPEERTTVFHSSGTTNQRPGRHFHGPASLAVYAASLWRWFQPHFRCENEFLFLTPDPGAAPRSSLVHMCAIVHQNARPQSGLADGLAERANFFGRLAGDGTWTVDFAALLRTLESVAVASQPVTIIGTAFSFLHLLDFLAERQLRLALPRGSQVMETGGYKNRSRVLPKNELHAFITRQLGVDRDNIICEYGMSELSSQAYDLETQPPAAILPSRAFHFPPWARVKIISPESGCEVAEGEPGLVRVLDLANVFSVAAIQTEDLGVRRGEGFELLGRAQLSEPRGCSLMTA